MSSHAYVLFSCCQGSSMTYYPWPIAHTVALHTTSERGPGQRQARRPSVGGDDAGPLSHHVLCCPLCWEVNHLNPHLHPLGCHHIRGPWEQLSSGKEERALCSEQCSPLPTPQQVAWLSSSSGLLTALGLTSLCSEVRHREQTSQDKPTRPHMS